MVSLAVILYSLAPIFLYHESISVTVGCGNLFAIVGGYILWPYRRARRPKRLHPNPKDAKLLALIFDAADSPHYRISDISRSVNFRQRIVLAVGATAIALMAMFPPWYFTLESGSTKFGSPFAGYHAIWQANTPTDTTALSEIFQYPVEEDDLSYFSVRLDTTRLGVQIAATVMVMLLLCAILHGKPQTRSPAKIC